MIYMLLHRYYYRAVFTSRNHPLSRDAKLISCQTLPWVDEEDSLNGNPPTEYKKLIK